MLRCTAGRLLGRAEHPIAMNQPEPDHAEHDSRRHLARRVPRGARRAGQRRASTPATVRGIGFDATCSLVVRDGTAARSASRATGDDALGHDRLARPPRARRSRRMHARPATACSTIVGGVMSPEMETPKLMWLKRHLPRKLGARPGCFFDLADFLTCRRHPARSPVRNARSPANGPIWPMRDQAGRRISSQASAWPTCWSAAACRPRRARSAPISAR